MQARRDHSWILKVIVSIAVLIALWFLIDLKALDGTLGAVTLPAVLLVLALIPLSMSLRALRLWLLLGHGIRYGDALRMTLVGETLNIFLPASSGDLAKAYYGVREHGRKEIIVTATIIDKASGLIGLLLLGAAAALLHGYTLLGVGFALFAATGLLFYFIPAAIPWKLLAQLANRIRKNSIDFTAVKAAFIANPASKSIAIGVSLIGWCVSYIHLYVIARLFGVLLDPLFLMSVAPLISLSRLFPFAFAGLGVQEGVTASLFSLANVPAALSVVISLTATLCSTIIPGIIGLYFFLRMKKAS